MSRRFSPCCGIPLATSSDMVERDVPTAQFHPYQRPTAIPHAHRPPEGIERLLAIAGVHESTVRRVRARSLGLIRRNRTKLLFAMLAVMGGILFAASRRREVDE